MNYPDRVTIVEVGPRDGLQNEPELIPTSVKVEFIRALLAAGCRDIEITSFVHPQSIPQLADSEALCQSLIEAGLLINAHSRVGMSGLVPNEKGLQRALQTRLQRIAIFTAASETFTQKNIRMNIEQSLAVYEPVVSRAISQGLSVRGYLSTCFVCPYEGDIPKERVRDLTLSLLQMGVDQVAISDTIGAATPRDIENTIEYLLNRVSPNQLALHLHDTYGTALANVVAGLNLGITTFDSSAGGLGGCPYAPGASGNLATEDLVYMLERMGIETGIDLDRLADASNVIARQLNRELPSRQLRRVMSQRANPNQCG